MNDSSHKHLLVIRFSSLGDVAMTVPVIRQLLEQHPDLKLTMLTDEKFAPLFEGIPRLHLRAIALRTKYKGVSGLYRLFRELKNENKFNAVADLHNVVRTKLLGLFFGLSGHSVFKIDKGRAEKKMLIRKKNKQLIQLETTFQRYAKVFADAGYTVELSNESESKRAGEEPLPDLFKSAGHKKRIGLAPFAKHREKMYPLEKMESVLEWLYKNDHQVFLFGGGAAEIEKFKEWEKKFPGVISIAGKYSFQEELKLIGGLDLMISMDSANMHLASLYGVPVVSIWGATHPYAGFYGYGLDPSNIIQVDLECRPCSVFGNKVCYRGDWACMQRIAPDMVTNKIKKLLDRK